MMIKNKKAHFDYSFLDKYIAGIVLTGTEIKSIRDGKASLVDTYCYIQDGEMWLKNSYIAEYKNGGYINHEVRRVRKLLLHKDEIRKLANKTKVPGLTIIPLSMYINDRGICKVEIALCKGKKVYDKRSTLKEKDSKREIDKILKRV